MQSTLRRGATSLLKYQQRSISQPLKQTIIDALSSVTNDPSQAHGLMSSFISPITNSYFPTNDLPFGLGYVAYQAADCLNSLIGINMSLLGCGLMPAILISSSLVKVGFIPFTLSMQKVGLKMRSINEISDKIKQRMKRYQRDGNNSGSDAESKKLKALYKANGVYGSISLIGSMQIPVYVCWASIIYMYISQPQYFSQLGSFLWIKDLTMPDPLGVFPIISCTVALGNMSMAPSYKQSNMMRGFKKYAPLLPVFLLPFWLTVPSAFNIFWAVNSLIHFGVVMYSQTKYHKNKVIESTKKANLLISKEKK